ncbi:MAG: DUF6524 family protein [Campylobacterota bacterium]|nr:DUF6524 family protein [Campylobacterota bacterium]
MSRNIPWYAKLILSFALVFGTWNPLEFDIAHYVMGLETFNLLVLFFLILLLVIWLIALRALHEAMGTSGILIYLILVGLLIGGLYQMGFIDINNLDTLGWYLNGIMTFMLFTGLMAPIWWRRMTGKVTVDDDMS